MTTPAAVLKGIANGMHDSTVRKGILAVLPLGHILRGLTFERASQKGMYYLWRVVMPLYRPRTVLSLNYSTRIGAGTYLFDIGSHSLEEAVREVSIAILESQSWNALRAIESPKEFLLLMSHVDTEAETDRRTLMDMAFSHWLIGEKNECVSILLRSQRIPIEYEYEHALSEEIARILSEIDFNPALLSTRLAGWELLCKENLLGNI